MTTASTLVVLYCIATAVAIAVRRLRVPYTVSLVVVGLALGWGHFIDPPHLTQELLFTFFLPGLLFEAAFHLHLKDFRHVWKSAITLAVPGVAVAVAITAGLVVLLSRMTGALDPMSALVFGAVVAATDPVAVTALFRELRVSPRLAALLESESLFNDGTGVVLFTLIVAYASGETTGLLAGTLKFATIALGGVAVGLGIGWVVSQVIRRVDEPVIEIGLTVIAAYGSFVLAESFHLSGVLATVIAGMMCGHEGRDRGMNDISRAAVENFWLYIAFALNSIVFLLIGFEFNPLQHPSIWTLAIGGFVAMMIARSLTIAGLMAVRPLLREEIPGAWSSALVFGGLRGALSVVLVLALPLSLPNRDILVSMTVDVVLLSIIGQGLSMPTIIRRARLSET